MDFQRLFSIACWSSIILGCGGCFSTQERNREFETMGLIQQGRFAEAQPSLAKISEEYSDTRHRLLWHLQNLIGQYWGGSADSALMAAQEAEIAMDDYDQRATISLRDVGHRIASTLTQRGLEPYRGHIADRIMLHTYKALIYLKLQKVEAAKVEMRQAAHHRQLAIDRHRKEIEKRERKAREHGINPASILQNPAIEKAKNDAYGDVELLPYLDDFANPMQIFLESLLNLNSSEPQEKEHGQKLMATLLNMQPKNSALMECNELFTSPQPSPSSNPMVYILWEQGLAPKLKSEELNLPLPIRGRLSIIHLALPHLLPVAHSANVSLRMNQRELSVSSLANFDAIQAAQLKAQIPSLVLQQVVASFLKAIAENQLAKESPTLGLALSLFNSAVNQADTRSWTSLPKEVFVGQTEHLSHEAQTLYLNGSILKVPSEPGPWLLHLRTVGHNDIHHHWIRL